MLHISYIIVHFLVYHRRCKQKSNAVVLQAWSLNQQGQHHPVICYRCEFPGLTPDLLSGNTAEAQQSVLGDAIQVLLIKLKRSDSHCPGVWKEDKQAQRAENGRISQGQRALKPKDTETAQTESERAWSLRRRVTSQAHFCLRM